MSFKYRSIFVGSSVLTKRARTRIFTRRQLLNSQVEKHRFPSSVFLSFRPSTRECGTTTQSCSKAFVKYSVYSSDIVLKKNYFLSDRVK